ncbi:MAG: DUF1059 domain-containing protein [Acidimicrobiales bacterium]
MSYQFTCRDAGHASCRWKGSAGTEAELLAQIDQHVREKHAVKKTTDTIANYVKQKIRST